MFTGIIEGLGEIKSIRSESKSFSLDIDTGDVLENPSLGESVAIDGVCLTIEAWKHSIMSFDVSKETLNRTTFNDLREGNRVNLERAMRLGDRVGGHIVQGHVDGTARVQIVRADSTSALRPILEEYYERTGVPMLLNTSLNIKGEPMVNTRTDAERFQTNYGVRVF